MTESVETSASIQENTRSHEDFANLEDRGATLFVRVKRADGGSIPVVMTREALEIHFGAEKGEKSLAQAYLAHRGTINAKALELDPAGGLYTDSNPMLLGAGDFG